MSRARAWTHRLAWVVLVVAVAMICAGGLVTSYRAGMAVPDWPTTFGHNPLLYPVGDWTAGRDVFLAHGHRLLGIVLAALTLALAAAVWTLDRRTWTGWLALAAVAVLCVQETLGGLRVLADNVFWATIHGSTAPLFLGVVAMIVRATSSATNDAAPVAAPCRALPGRVWRWLVPAAVYAQIVLGSLLRHLPFDASTRRVVFWVWLYWIVAAVVLGLAAALVVRQGLAGPSRRRRRAWRFAGLVVVQFALGAVVWITNFGWPRWFTRLAGPPDYTVVAEGTVQVLATTAQVVVGAMCLLAVLAVATQEEVEVQSTKYKGRSEKEEVRRKE